MARSEQSESAEQARQSLSLIDPQERADRTAGKVKLSSAEFDGVGFASGSVTDKHDAVEFASETRQSNDAPPAVEAIDHAGAGLAATVAEPELKDLPRADAVNAEVPTVVLGFDQAMFAGLSNHPTIGAALETIRQSEGDYLQSTLLPNPQLFTDIQMLPYGRPFTPDRQGGPPQQDVFVTYPIDWFLFGKRTASMISNQYGIHISQADYQDLLRKRIELIATIFFDVVEAHALAELAQANLDNLERVEVSTKQAVDVGKRPAVEFDRIHLDVLSAKQEQRRAQAIVISREAALRSVTGYTGELSRLRAAWDLATPLQLEAVSLEQAILLAESSRPDLESLRWQATKAGADIVVEQRAAKPAIAPSFGWTHQYQKAIEQPDADSWNANVTMSVPIFDRNQGRIAKAQASQRQVHCQYQVRVLEVRAEVQQAVAELRAAEDNARAVADEQLALAKKVRDSIVEAYELGGRPLIDVLDAQRNYRETYRLYITTRSNFWKSLYHYRAVIGRQVSDNE